MQQSDFSSIILTEWSQTKQGGIALFTKEGFLFSVDWDTFVQFDLEHKIQKSSPLSSGELALLARQSHKHKARQWAFTLLQAKMYSQKQLRDKLAQKYEAEDVEWAISEMNRIGYLDDFAYTQARVATLLRKNKSKTIILQDLYQKGIAQEVTLQVLEELYQQQGQEAGNMRAIQNLLQKQYTRKLQQGKIQQVQAALARRGFGYSEIRQAIQQWIEQKPEDIEILEE